MKGCWNWRKDPNGERQLQREAEQRREDRELQMQMLRMIMDCSTVFRPIINLCN